MAKSKCRWNCPEDWSEWSELIAAVLHGRNRWRLPVLMVGILFASGRRTVTTWFRAAGVSDEYQAYYYLIAALGRKTEPVATQLAALLLQTYEQLSNYDELFSRIKTLLSEDRTLGVIATQLNEDGFHPPKRSSTFSAGILTRFLRDRGIRTGRLPKSVTHENHLHADEWWLSDLAAKLGMPIATLHRWQRAGWLTSRKVSAAGKRWAIFADSDELSRLTHLCESPRGWPNPHPPELITPKPNPNFDIPKSQC